MRMNYIVYVCDNNEYTITFERFNCKKLDTVKKNMVKLLNNDLYCVCIKGAKKVKIYRTPNGYTREEEPVFVMDI